MADFKRPRLNDQRDVKVVAPGHSSSGAARKVTSFTDKTYVQYSAFPEMFTPNWDATIASEQAMTRVKERVDVGQKMTPRGPGRLRPAKR